MNAREMIGVVAAPGETAAQTAIRAAFKLGQESMRERVANIVQKVDGFTATANAIRALPVEE